VYRQSGNALAAAFRPRLCVREKENRYYACPLGVPAEFADGRNISFAALSVPESSEERACGAVLPKRAPSIIRWSGPLKVTIDRVLSQIPSRSRLGDAKTVWKNAAQKRKEIS